MVIPQLLVDDEPTESTTWDVSPNDPAADGIPVIAPVTGFSTRPFGRLPAVIEYV